MVTNVYVDGPNLYYAALKDKVGLRWLDLVTWSERLLPGHEIKRVRYFTAWANPARPSGQAERQRWYLRALDTLPEVSLHFGRCIKDTVQLTEPRPSNLTRTVIKVREKGVDVALATKLLVDAARRDCDTAVIVSSDSDLRTPIEAARKQLRIRVGVINPREGSAGNALKESVNFHIRPEQGSYKAAQLPAQLRDSRGVITVPKEWTQK